MANSIRTQYLELEKSITDSDHLLLMQRTPDQFAAPTWHLTIMNNSSSMGSNVIFWSRRHRETYEALHMYRCKQKTQIHKTRSKIYKIYFMIIVSITFCFIYFTYQLQFLLPPLLLVPFPTSPLPPPSTAAPFLFRKVQASYEY